MELVAKEIQRLVDDLRGLPKLFSLSVFLWSDTIQINAIKLT